MAVDQSLIEGAKDLLYQDYYDINIPLSASQAEMVKDDTSGLTDEEKDKMKSTFQGIGQFFNKITRGGGRGPSLVDLCPNLQGGPGAPTKQRASDVPEVTVEDEKRERPKPKMGFDVDSFDKNTDGYIINPNVPRKDMKAFDQLLKDKIRTTTRHYIVGDAKGISDIPGGSKVMTGLFKGAKKALFTARKEKDTEMEQQVTSDITNFMKQMADVKASQEEFFEIAGDSQIKGSSALMGDIYSAASSPQHIRYMEQVYGGQAEASLVNNKLHFNVLDDEGKTVLVPYDEIDKDVILKDAQSELAFVDYTEDVRMNASSGKPFNEQKAKGMLENLLADGSTVKDFVLKDWVMDNKAGFNFKTWFENNFPMASLDFINDPIAFENNKKQLKDAVIEYYVDILKNEHNNQIGIISGEITISDDKIKAFTKRQLQEINKKSQNLPD